MTKTESSRVVVLVDGEHSPSVVRSALDDIEQSGCEICALVFLGGSEKADPDHYPVEVELIKGESPADALSKAIFEHRPDEVIDLSDDPVVDQALREELVAIAASSGVSYSGPGYRFDPPRREKVAGLPTIAVVGTGKRTGKTAVCAALARCLAGSGARPIIVTMGRGGPKKPVFIPPGGIPTDPAALIELANDGLHAASDYIEDALFTGLPSIGAWRCGGGFLGDTGPNVVSEAVELAVEKSKELGCDIILLEGSGASIPPIDADATVTVTPWPKLVSGTDPGPGLDHRDPPGPPKRTKAVIGADRGSGPFTGLGLYRLLIADAVVTTMCPADVESSELAAAGAELIGRKPNLRVVNTAFELTPTAAIDGKRVVLATTAREAFLPELKRRLAVDFGAKVVGVTTNLSRREVLREDLASMLEEADVLLTELKASAVDIAARQAIASGVEVMFVENRPRPVGGNISLEELALYLRGLAQKRFEAGESRWTRSSAMT